MTEAVLVAMLAVTFAATGQTGVPGGEAALGSVRLDRRVLADGNPLAAGTYEVRLTAERARPDAAGADAALERWVEFLQDGRVVGREIVSIVPKGEVAAVAEKEPPAPGTSRVDLLKGGEYVRIWINRDGVSYLIHLPVM